ncbi:23S rRNA (pseudouridine(1915)-N(3))-methyltransferase RlmH [Saccharicrinis sp. FJH54]|uniref:23S rRNA (pseudouridine(1915)-N(3))-methyltransferase RlmH n=1 Tax=Saccharicrinis sp. FJH54 TaxID=3344665 RepID=UPI0035D406A9
MNIKLIAVGKTDSDHVKVGTELYIKRIKRYINFDFVIIPDLKKSKKRSEDVQKELEGKIILDNLQAGDYLVLLDEYGKELRSVEFADFIQKRMNSGIKQLVFLIGGPYGFSEEVKKRCDYTLSLSKMTYSHQLVRVLFAEQLYRAFSIIKGEPYHHE